jgi:hypothetical protein
MMAAPNDYKINLRTAALPFELTAGSFMHFVCLPLSMFVRIARSTQRQFSFVPRVIFRASSVLIQTQSQ